MAIGEGSYGGYQRKNQDLTYYSRFNIKNGEMKALTATFWAGLLQISIDTKEGASTDVMARYVNLIKINISAMKARILVNQIKAFEDYVASAKTIDEKKAFGINTGIGDTITFLALHANKEKTPIITIGKFDNEGVITEKADFVIAKDHNYGLDWSDLESNKLDKHFYNNVDFEYFKSLVTNFANNMDGALAYSVHDLGRYDIRRNTDKIEQIMGKLGLEVFRPNNYNSNRTNDFLNGTGTSKSNTGTGSVSHSIDDIM